MNTDLPKVLDLAVAWEWPLDQGFVERLLVRAAETGCGVLPVTQANLPDVLRDLLAGELQLRSVLDRASDERPEFSRLGDLARERGARLVNAPHLQDRSCDKARSHLTCALHGVPVPYTLIVPPFVQDPSPPRLPGALGRPFVAKPAFGAGGQGVVLDVSTTADVQNARRVYWRERYLLQQRVLPRRLNGRRAWFRAFCIHGQVIPCWWDDISHVYAPLTAAEEYHWGLTGIRPIVLRIRQLTGLDFFTSEIVLGCDGRLLCVDYANSPCDLRLQSSHRDGVPDEVVDRIIEHLLAEARYGGQRTPAGT
ncbi:MAG: ATP-grasp domain-containing protein [Anaerolineae bacterium]